MIAKKTLLQRVHVGDRQLVDSLEMVQSCYMRQLIHAPWNICEMDTEYCFALTKMLSFDGVQRSGVEVRWSGRWRNVQRLLQATMPSFWNYKIAAV